MFLRDPNGFEGKKRKLILGHECPWRRASSVSPLLVSVRVGFVEPFGNLLGAFESGRFQTTWSVVSKGAQWFPSQKNDFAPRLDAGSVKDSVMPLLVSVKIGFLEPFGNLLAPFECGCFQTP